MGISSSVMMGITAIASAGSAIAGGIEGSMASAARTQALQQQMVEVESQARAKQLAHLRQVNQTLGRQALIGASNGYDLSSTSFAAVSLDTMNKHEEDRNADLLSENYQKQAIDQQIENSKSSGTMSLVNGALGAAKSVTNLFGNKLFESAQGSNASTAISHQLQKNEMAELPGGNQMNNAMSSYRQSPLFQPITEF